MYSLRLSRYDPEVFSHLPSGIFFCGRPGWKIPVERRFLGKASNYGGDFPAMFSAHVDGMINQLGKGTAGISRVADVLFSNIIVAVHCIFVVVAVVCMMLIIV